MKLTTINEIKNASEEFNPEAFKGEVKRVYDFKQGEGARGTWTLQPILVTEGGEEVRVVFSGRNQYASSQIEGTELFAKAHKTKSGNWSGLKVKISEWKGETKKELFVYESADVSFGNEAEGSAIIDHVSSSETSTQTTSTAENSSFEKFEKNEQSIDGVKQALQKSANMMLVCLDASVYIKTQFENKHDREMTNEHFQAICSSLFINADKRGLITEMPNTQMDS
jgi:hypothetical protein